MIVIKRLTTEYLESPIAVPLIGLRFGWEIESTAKNQRQIAYRIIVKTNGTTVWDSGKVYSSETNGIEYSGERLSPRKKYLWRVKVYGDFEESSEFSDWQSFETTLSEKEWEGVSFIGAKNDELSLFRKSFNLQNKKILSARVYACGLGSYNLFLNGKRVNGELLNPLVTRYHIRYFYNAYDITSMLNIGENVFWRRARQRLLFYEF